MSNGEFSEQGTTLSWSTIQENFETMGIRELLQNEVNKPTTEEERQRLKRITKKRIQRVRKAIKEQARIIYNWASRRSSSNPSEALRTEENKPMTAAEEKRIKAAHDEARLIAGMTFEEFLVWSDPPPLNKDDVNVESPKMCVPNTWKKYFGWLEEEASNFDVLDDEEWFGDEKERQLALIHEVVIPAYHDAQILLPQCNSLSEALCKALDSRLTGDSSIALIPPELFDGSKYQIADGSFLREFSEPEAESVMWKDDVTSQHQFGSISWE